MNQHDEQQQERLLSRKEAAEYLGVSPQTLAFWACRRTRELPFVKLGRRVKYRKSDLDAFVSHMAAKEVFRPRTAVT